MHILEQGDFKGNSLRCHKMIFFFFLFDSASLRFSHCDRVERTCFSPVQIAQSFADASGTLQARAVVKGRVGFSQIKLKVPITPLSYLFRLPKTLYLDSLSYSLRRGNWKIPVISNLCLTFSSHSILVMDSCDCWRDRCSLGKVPVDQRETPKIRFKQSVCSKTYPHAVLSLSMASKRADIGADANFSWHKEISGSLTTHSHAQEFIVTLKKPTRKNRAAQTCLTHLQNCLA